MPIKPILQLGNPELYKKCEPVNDVESTQTKQLVTDLADTLAEFREHNGFGRAIAAPQIGGLQRVIWVKMQDGGFNGAIINPKIVREDSSRIKLWDNCLSFPELMVRVSRAASITVEYIDEKSQPQTLEATGDLSELLQHELDHLDGVLAVQRALSPTSFCTRAEYLRTQ